MDIPNTNSENFGNVPHNSEPFGNVQNRSETFRNVPNRAERKESHTLTVREAARMFERAGVTRTERSIVNWCHLNKQGVPRLDCYFDPNEKKFFITPTSVELAIKEEQSKILGSTALEASRKALNGSDQRTSTTEEAEEIRVLKQENLDLKITNRAKDYFIDQLQQERLAFADERKTYVEQLMISNRRVGELETKLLQLTSPNQGQPGKIREVAGGRQVDQAVSGN